MPPRPRIRKKDIINAGFDIVRRQGADKLSVRAVSAELGCSTQPVMYHYKTVEELKADIYAAADSFHTMFIMTHEEGKDPLLSLGMNFIRFAVVEKNLFRFLFQSDKFGKMELGKLFSGSELRPILNIVFEQASMSGEEAGAFFEALFYCTHGVASLIANNSIQYDDAHIERILSSIFDTFRDKRSENTV